MAHRLPRTASQHHQAAATFTDDADAGHRITISAAGRSWRGWTAPELVHIGALDPALKGKTSYEGRGLSVSTTPEAWESIAGLGGFPWWSLTPPIGDAAIVAGGAFVDFRAEKTALQDAAIRAGFLVEEKRYRARHSDDNDQPYYTLHPTRADALLEVDEDATCVRGVKVLVATPELVRRVGRAVDDVSALDLAATELVDAGIIPADGVFWNERLDVVGLSAPRAVIVPSRLPAWLATARTLAGPAP